MRIQDSYIAYKHTQVGVTNMSELLNSYTFSAKKVVYYSVTVGAENKTEAKRIASDFEHCKHYEEVEYCDGYEYKVGKLLETTDEKWLS